MSYNYLVNTPRIVHETIDDETVIIDFDTGAYFSARSVANRIWLLLCAGKSRAQIVQTLTAHYAVAETTAEEDTDRFLSALSGLSLIVESSGAGGRGADAPAQTHSANGGPKQAYETPVLEQFTDMQELLLLDPIHDVSSEGWPQRPA